MPARVLRWCVGRAPALAVGALVGALGAGALVYAQGSGSGEIRACLVPGATGPNVRIIGAGERCPSGTPVTWNTQGPAGATGPAGPAGQVTPELISEALKPPAGAAPDTSLKRALRGLKPKARKYPFKGVTKSQGPNPGAKFVFLQCPASHPKVVTGGFVVKGIDDYDVYSNAPNSWSSPDSWITHVAQGSPPLKSWTLKVSAKCAKK